MTSDSFPGLSSYFDRMDDAAVRNLVGKSSVTSYINHYLSSRSGVALDSRRSRALRRLLQS